MCLGVVEAMAFALTFSNDNFLLPILWRPWTSASRRNFSKQQFRMRFLTMPYLAKCPQQVVSLRVPGSLFRLPCAGLLVTPFCLIAHGFFA